MKVCQDLSVQDVQSLNILIPLFFVQYVQSLGILIMLNNALLVTPLRNP